MASPTARPSLPRSADPCCESRRFLTRNFAPFRPSRPLWALPKPEQRRTRRVCLFSLHPGRGATGGVMSSWLHQGGSRDEFGGWFVVQHESEKRSEPFHFSPRFLTIAVGTSVAVLLAALAHFSISRKGSKLQFNMIFHAFRGLLTPLESSSTLHCEDNQISEKILEDKHAITHDASILTMNNDMPALGEKRRIVPFAADSTQQQALSVLKKLKIIEDDVKPDELCTRREYARWLVKTNSLLERNPRHKFILPMSTGISTVTAFDDVNVDDPDFWCIQALGETGIVPCKLLAAKSNISEENGSVNHGECDFQPESFLSRLDLVNWRAQLEYAFAPGIGESRC